MKIVYNNKFGVFRLSTQVLEWFKAKGWDDYTLKSWIDEKRFRSHSRLVECVEELKEKANGEHTILEIKEVPDGSIWSIRSVDGKETVIVEDLDQVLSDLIQKCTRKELTDLAKKIIDYLLNSENDYE